MQFRLNAIMIITLDMFSIKSNRMVNGVCAMNAISTTNLHQAFMGTETTKDTHHTPIGNAIAYVNTKVRIIERRESLHLAGITHIDFEIAFVERL